MKILVDEMHENWVKMLRDHGFDAHSAKRLKETHGISTDYSIMKYVQDNKMFFITDDKECGKGCEEQGIPYLFIDSAMIFNHLVLPKLEKYR